MNWVSLFWTLVLEPVLSMRANPRHSMSESGQGQLGQQVIPSTFYILVHPSTLFVLTRGSVLFHLVQ